VAVPVGGLIDWMTIELMNVTFSRDGFRNPPLYESVMEWASLEKLVSLHDTVESACQFDLEQEDRESRKAGEKAAKFEPAMYTMLDPVYIAARYVVLFNNAGEIAVVFKVDCIQDHLMDEYEFLITGVRASAAESDIHKRVVVCKESWNLTVSEVLKMAKLVPNKDNFENPVVGTAVGVTSMTDGRWTCSATSEAATRLLTKDDTSTNVPMCMLVVLTLHEDSEYQAVDDAAVSSLIFILTSCVPNFEASNTNSRDPVVGSEVCETVMLIDTLLQLEFVTAIAGKRSMRGDETDIFVKQAELAGSLI